MSSPTLTLLYHISFISNHWSYLPAPFSSHNHMTISIVCTSNNESILLKNNFLKNNKRLLFKTNDDQQTILETNEQEPLARNECDCADGRCGAEFVYHFQIGKIVSFRCIREMREMQCEKCNARNAMREMQCEKCNARNAMREMK
jgi:ribosomal protein L40E